MFNNKQIVVFIIILSLFILIHSSFAIDSNNTVEKTDINEIHVDINGNDSNTGDFENPLATVNKAINVSSNNSKIIIHEGVYRENNLNITKSLEIHGEGNVVIDAENSSRIFTINTQTSDSVVLNGITFTNGRAYQGGAVYVRNAHTTISNSKFINNTALTEGGAIYWNSDHGTLINTVVEGNTARDGAGVSWGGINSTFTGGDYGEIINCTFSNNHLVQNEDACIGLSIYSNRMKVINSTFVNHSTLFNSSFEVVYINGDYSTVTGCLFANNSMTLTGALGFDGNYAEAYNNVFVNNSISCNDSFGGAIGSQSETLTVNNNTFIANGGQYCNGGAIFINTVETFQFNFITITNNVFINNKAQRGGGIYTTSNSNFLTLLIENNTFKNDEAIYGAGIYLTDIYDPVTVQSNNFTDLTAEKGSGIYAYSCSMDIFNNKMNNCSSDDGGDIYSYGNINSDLTLIFKSVIGAVNRSVTLTAVLLDDSNNTISTDYIDFYVNGVQVKGTRSINAITSTFNSLGVSQISGYYEKGTAHVENATLTLLNPVNLNIDNITVYGRNAEIKLNVTDDVNRPISNANVIINFNGNEMLLVTDGAGFAKTDFNNLDAGNYTFKARFIGDSEYISVNKTFAVNVFTSIISSDLKRAYNSGSDFKATLLNKDGSPLNNSKVTVNVKDKKYEAITDENGEFILNEKLNPGNYIVSVINPVTLESVSNNLNIVKRLSGNANVNMYFGAGSYYSLRVYSDDGSVVGAGETVKISFNGKNYNVKTDKNGYAKFKISANPKTYTITAAYKGVKVSNKIVVKKVLIAKNISKKKSKTVKFSVKLVNAKGKVVKGKKITFKLKGKTYTAKTNAKGIATIKIKNLKVGKYTITTKYGKSSLKNVIKIKK